MSELVVDRSCRAAALGSCGARLSTSWRGVMGCTVSKPDESCCFFVSGLSTTHMLYLGIPACIAMVVWCCEVYVCVDMWHRPPGCWWLDAALCVMWGVDAELARAAVAQFTWLFCTIHSCTIIPCWRPQFYPFSRGALSCVRTYFCCRPRLGHDLCGVSCACMPCQVGVVCWFKQVPTPVY